MEFVEDWSILHTLGQGAFGEVKLLVHCVTGDTVAVKIIDCELHKDAAESIKKEVCVHRLLSHPNVIRFYGQRKEGLKQYIFLEYASGGELFNKIEPDIGMPLFEAQRYFRQLLSGVEYLHRNGVAHRDIKPENLLLDHNTNLKITDFGMATVFRLRGKERKLEKRCGTMPYIAPEVLKGPYHAEAADIWSCGIVLVAMLAGELPWDQPTLDQIEYQSWVDGKYMLLSPWKKLDNMALSLARCILLPETKQRFNLEKINKHRWLQHVFQKIIDKDEVDSTEVSRPAKRLCSNNDLPLSQKVSIPDFHIGLSQPILQYQKEDSSSGQVVSMIRDRDKHLCFSQPTYFDDLFIGSDLQFTQSKLNKNNFQKLVSRMTRFFVTTDCEKTLNILCNKLEKDAYNWKTAASGMLTISTVDSRKMQLVFKANILNMDGKLLLDFRLSKGCGIEFKKRFLKLKQSMKDIILENECK